MQAVSQLRQEFEAEPQQHQQVLLPVLSPNEEPLPREEVLQRASELEEDVRSLWLASLGGSMAVDA